MKGKIKRNRLKGKITLINMISTLLLQIVTIISGFIVPKIILSYFGSNINGLVASISQFLSYITLLEGGVTGVISANLYKPLIEKENEKINSILSTADKFYKKIGLIFIIYAIGLAIIYPLIFKTDFSYGYVFTLTIILALNLFIQYMFSLTLKTLLNADKKVYIVSYVQIIIVILNIILAIVSAKMFSSIHVLKLITGLLYILQPLIYGIYVKKNYNVKLNYQEDKKLIKERWNGFAINIAYFIHNSTDITILTIFTNLSIVSVYSVYSLVVTGLKQLISSFTSGINPTIGQAYAKGDLVELNEKLNVYEYIVNILVFFLFSVASLLITPFVLLYTSDIKDADYNQSLFGILLIISEAIYLLKLPHLNLAYSANKFKELTIPAFLEAIINIIISIVLVNKMGLIGVAIGTIVAMVYRMAFHVYFSKKLIKRKQWIFYSKLIVFIIGAIIGCTICKLFFPIIEISIYSWILHAIGYILILGIIYLIVSILFFRNELKFFKQYLRH